MVSKSQKKFIQRLQQKKFRKQEGVFVAEGKKTIEELLSAGFELHSLFSDEVDSKAFDSTIVHNVTTAELEQLSFLKTPQSSLAIFKIPTRHQMIQEGLILVLDDVRDPGNMGTIIRLCDWFGIRQLICSEETVDCYNPKVIQATMGSIARVRIHYTNLTTYLATVPKDVPVFGTFMNGNSIYTENLPTEGYIIMGNEANGISSNIAARVTNSIGIPRFGAVQKTESLNVATATAIILNEFRRRS